MNIESITFNTAENKIVVTLPDGTSKEYYDSTSYIRDYPERKEDCLAMGWG